MNAIVVLAAVPIAVAALMALPWPWRGEVRYGEDAIKRVTGQTEHSKPLDVEEYTRSNVHFNSHGETIEAYLYEPKPRPHIPAERSSVCVIMAHGLGGQRDFGLHKYADLFVSAGYTVLVFDYRNFGGSTGEPRHWVCPTRHVQDWEAAIDAVKHNKLLDANITCSKLVLWGNSFAGGHVIVAAAKQPDRIAAIISSVPHLSGVEASKKSLQNRGLLGSLRMLLVGLHDKLRSLAGLPPAYIKLVGKPGELAFMQLSDVDMEAYWSRHPAEKLGGWQPYALARLSLQMSRYSPIFHLDKVQAPVLFVMAARDHLCPGGVVRRAAEVVRGAGGELFEYDVGHFHVYVGEPYEHSSAQMVRFIRQHTGL